MKYKFEVLDARWTISSKDLETLTIKLIIKDTRPIFVTSVYRPPNGIVKNCLSHLYELYECTTLPNKNERIIGGDFNINFRY